MNSRPMQIASALCMLVASLGASAAQRTFVASAGNDANPCTIVMPCRGFAAAIALTDAGGEVIVQDSAGYGRVTITKSVSIIAPPGVYGGITVPLGFSGVVISGSGVSVLLRGLTINGPAGLHGISFGDGAQLTIEDCEIANMVDAAIVAVAPNSTVTVKNTVLRGNRYGYQTDHSVTTLDGVHIYNSSDYGVLAGDGSMVTITNSVFSMNKMVGVFVFSFSQPTNVMVTHSTITGSAIGVKVSANIAQVANAVVNANSVYNATTGAFLVGSAGGTENIYSAGNNTVGTPLGVSQL